MHAVPSADLIYIPTSFDLQGEFSLSARPFDSRWDSLEKTIRRVSPRAVVSLLPISWQMNPLVYNSLFASKTLGTPAVTGNLPLTVEIVRQLGADMVVTTPEYLFALIVDVPDVTLLPVRSWHLVVDVRNFALPLPPLPGIVRDLHLMPGVSVALQCEHLSGSTRFHPAAGFVFAVDGEGVRIAPQDGTHASFAATTIKGKLEASDCPCGERQTLSLYA